MSLASRRPRPAGMTLTELLVVLAIILLVSAAALPTALVALAEREVSEAASIVQANFSQTRDRASGSGQPAGIRLLPDSDTITRLPNGSIDPGSILASNRMIPLSSVPAYSEGLIIPIIEIGRLPGGVEVRRLAVYEAKTDSSNLLAPPTSWYNNIRQGDTLRIEGTSISYSIVGPMSVGPAYGNPERFVNETVERTRTGTPTQSLPTNNQIEKLFLLNGRDDSPTGATVGSGYVDEAFDGIDNNGDGYIDPGYNGEDENGDGFIDDFRELILNPGTPSNPALAEYEVEEPISSAFEYYHIYGRTFDDGTPAVWHITNTNPTAANDISMYDTAVPRYRYTITRRPLVAPGAREISLPAGAVIDLTTTLYDLDINPLTVTERSRVPIDPVSGFVDLIIAPNGQVSPSTPFGASRALSDEFPFFYLWIASREDLTEPVPLSATRPTHLPITRAAVSAAPTAVDYPSVLEGERRLVTISPRSGHASVSEITEFSTTSVTVSGVGIVQPRDVPYLEARRYQQTGE